MDLIDKKTGQPLVGKVVRQGNKSTFHGTDEWGKAFHISLPNSNYVDASTLSRTQQANYTKKWLKSKSESVRDTIHRLM
jgi:hypothetical protein